MDMRLYKTLVDIVDQIDLSAMEMGCAADVDDQSIRRVRCHERRIASIGPVSELLESCCVSIRIPFVNVKRTERR
jgi:hypothetical protein